MGSGVARGSRAEAVSRAEAMGWLRRAGAPLLAAVGLLAAAAAPEPASAAWVKDEVRLNLRTQPGSGYRIVGSVKTGDEVAVLERGEGWTRVSVKGGGQGWIPEGFLQIEPPALIALERRSAELAELRDQMERLSREAEGLREENLSLSSDDDAQKQEIRQLTRENAELRAGARWPDRIAGALILGAGMLVGALLGRRSSRRQQPRIRL